MKILELIRGIDMEKVNERYRDLVNRYPDCSIRIVSHSYYEVGASFRISILVEISPNIVVDEGDFKVTT